MKRIVLSLAALALGVSLAGCSGQSQTAETSTSESASLTSSAFPAEVKSCSETLTFDKAPEKVLMLSETNASILYHLGVLDHVAYKTGVQRISNLDADLEAAIAKIETVESGQLDTGGAKVDTESVLELKPDLVIGFDSGADRDALREAGIPLYTPDSLCPNANLPKASWDLVNNEIDKMATMFGVSDTGEQFRSTLAATIENLTPKDGSTKTAVTLYVTPGSDEYYAYGNTSMVQPIFEANGLDNIYADNSTRVFDASMEDLLSKNPDVIVLVSEDGDEAAARATLEGFAGSDGLKAVSDNQVYYLPFVLTDPPTDLSVEGATTLSTLLNS